MIKKRISQNYLFSQSINQGPASVVGLQFFRRLMFWFIHFNIEREAWLIDCVQY